MNKWRKWLKLVTSLVDGIGLWLDWLDEQDKLRDRSEAREHFATHPPGASQVSQPVQKPL